MDHLPGFPECMTQGENMQDAYEMAWDALGLAVVSRIENRESLPRPQSPMPPLQFPIPSV